MVRIDTSDHSISIFPSVQPLCRHRLRNLNGCLQNAFLRSKDVLPFYSCHNGLIVEEANHFPSHVHYPFLNRFKLYSLNTERGCWGPNHSHNFFQKPTIFLSFNLLQSFKLLAFLAWLTNLAQHILSKNFSILFAEIVLFSFSTSINKRQYLLRRHLLLNRFSVTIDLNKIGKHLLFSLCCQQSMELVQEGMCDKCYM